MVRPLISVIIPVYNIGEYVDDCVASVCKQSYKEIEVILVDDGSMDDSGKICDEWAKRDDRVKVFHKKNGGLSDARNYGIKKAAGDLVVLVDGDDSVKVNYVEELYDAMLRDNSDIVVCGYNDIVPVGALMTGAEATSRLLTKQENIDVVAWNKLYKKNLFLDNGIWYPLGKKHEDALTTYKLLSKAEKVSYIQSSLYVYATRADSIMSVTKKEEKLLARESAAREAIDFFEKEDLKEAAEVSLLLAKYAYIDAYLRGEIDKKYYTDSVAWIRENNAKFKKNKCMSAKLRVYNFLLLANNGLLYSLFRRVRHE